MLRSTVLVHCRPFFYISVNGSHLREHIRYFIHQYYVGGWTARQARRAKKSPNWCSLYTYSQPSRLRNAEKSAETKFVQHHKTKTYFRYSYLSNYCSSCCKVSFLAIGDRTKWEQDITRISECRLSRLHFHFLPLLSSLSLLLYRTHNVGKSYFWPRASTGYDCGCCHVTDAYSYVEYHQCYPAICPYLWRQTDGFFFFLVTVVVGKSANERMRMGRGRVEQDTNGWLSPLYIIQMDVYCIRDNMLESTLVLLTVCKRQLTNQSRLAPVRAKWL